jgi:hypothetical protein
MERLRLVPAALGASLLASGLLIVGGREDLVAYARGRLNAAPAEESSWLQSVIAGLAADFPRLARAPELT